MWQSIDHSILSPSGHISKRAKKQYMDKFANELFGNGGRELLKPTCKQPTEKESLLRQAETLRDLAKRGMKPRAYLKQAIELENQANLLREG